MLVQTIAAHGLTHNTWREVSRVAGVRLLPTAPDGWVYYKLDDRRYGIRPGQERWYGIPPDRTTGIDLAMLTRACIDLAILPRGPRT